MLSMLPTRTHFPPIPFSHTKSPGDSSPRPAFPLSILNSFPHSSPHFSHLHPARGTPQRASAFPTCPFFLLSFPHTKSPEASLPPGQHFPRLPLSGDFIFPLPGRPLQLKILLRKLGGPQGRGHPGFPPANSAFPISTPSTALPSEPAPSPPSPIFSLPFPHTKSPEASRLRADISHVCPSPGTPFFRCRAAPYSLKSSSVNWEVRRGGATRGSRIRGSYW